MTSARMAGRIELWTPDRLQEYDRNPRTHSAQQIEQIAESIRAFGFNAPILVDEAGGEILAGHGRLAAARKLGLEEVPVVPLGHLTDEQRRAYVIADNKIALAAGWDADLLAAELADLDPGDLAAVGFSDAELADLLPDSDPLGGPEPDADAPGGEDPDQDTSAEDEAPELAELAVTEPGDVWILGPHRIMCADCTDPTAVKRLLAGVVPDGICTDPPYCSGGFQESGKGAGSVGTSAKAHKQIANDTLSTRGYLALLKAAFASIGAPYLYAFTDWRMWVHLFDVAESSGYGVRSMIVWDKGTPGMGRGWRSQHELILWGCKTTAPFDKHASGQGNVIQEKRTGNKYHTTEKPVALLERLLATAPFLQTVADPFTGSGSALIACEKLGRTFYGLELDPLYCDVAVRRWQQYTGQRAVHADTGEPFPE